jgi:hypothetical protein
MRDLRTFSKEAKMVQHRMIVGEIGLPITRTAS